MENPSIYQSTHFSTTQMAPTSTNTHERYFASASNFNPERICNFCKRNRESPAVYSNHTTKDARGKVTCPQLRKYICPGCGATGDEAHTRSYCPSLKLNTSNRHQDFHSRTATARQFSFNNQFAASFRGQQLQLNANYQRSLHLDQVRKISPERLSSHSDNDAEDIELGRSQALNNMSRVTNSRYNSAGRLRFRRNQQHNNPNHFKYN